MCAIKEKVYCPMSPEQKQGYTQDCAERILRFNWKIVLGIMGVQLYNLVYVLIYTKGKLYTPASRVYALLYLVLLLVSAAALAAQKYLRRKMPGAAKGVVRLQVLYGILLMAWGASVTIYDQRVSDNVSVYLIISMSVAVLVYFTPIQAAVVYGFFMVTLYFTLPIFQGEGVGDFYGRAVNLAVMTLTAVFMAVFRYATDRKGYVDQQIIARQKEYLMEVATRDSLTGLRNRRFYDEEMDGLYRQCAADGAVMTVMMMDIDFFKNYNDTYGHQQGDECLRRIAWRLGQEMEEGKEYLIRYGGEEFLYLGMGVDEQEAAEKGTRFCKAIRELVIGASGQDQGQVTISVGVCTRFPAEMMRQQGWTGHVALADHALYAAKNSGRDRWISI